MRRCVLLMFWAVVAATPLAAAPQANPSSAPPQQAAAAQPAPVFRTGVELVRLDVRITDADGRAVPDVRADEIEVFEGGERRPVLLFQHVVQPKGTYAEIAQRTIASEVSTNQGAPRGNVYVFVFDVLHITPGNEQRARLAADRFLRTRLRPGDRVALYALPGPGPHIEFTSDRARVLRELSTVRGSRNEFAAGHEGSMRVSDAYEIVRGNQDLLTRYVNRTADSPGTIDAPNTAERQSGRSNESPRERERLLTEDARVLVNRADSEARLFLQGLTAVVRSLRDVEGRKSLILLSEGFEMDNVRREIEEVSAAAAQTYALFYGLDLNRRADTLNQLEPAEASLGRAILSRLESLGGLATATDGVLFNDASAQADQVFDRISAAAQDYYLVGFEPAAAGLKDRNQYRRVRVNVNRAGARASTRSGYSVGPPVTAADRRRAIDGALRAPFTQQGLRIEYTTYLLRGTASDTQRVMLSLAVELPVAGQGAPPADVVFAVRNVADGRLAATSSDTIALPDATRTGSTAGVGYYRVQFELPAGQYLMRAVVREPGGLIGSADRRFQVRALGGPSLTAGDLILSSADTAGLPVRTTVYADETIAGVLELYGRTPEQVSGATVTTELLQLGSATPLTSGRADLLEVKTTASGSSRGARIDIPLQGVPPGEYLVRATVRSGRETAAELLRDVVVAPGSRPAAAPAPPAGIPASFDPNALLQGDVARRIAASMRERLAARPADHVAALADKAFSQFAARDYASAAAAWKTCLDEEPQHAGVAFLLGWAHAAGGDDRAAVTAWRSAVIADSTFVPAYLALVDAYLRLGQPDLALQVARAGQQALPASVELRDRVLRLERK